MGKTDDLAAYNRNIFLGITISYIKKHRTTYDGSFIWDFFWKVCSQMNDREKSKNYSRICFEYNLHRSSIFLAKFYRLLLLVVRLKFIDFFLYASYFSFP